MILLHQQDSDVSEVWKGTSDGMKRGSLEKSLFETKAFKLPAHFLSDWPVETCEGMAGAGKRQGLWLTGTILSFLVIVNHSE